VDDRPQPSDWIDLWDERGAAAVQEWQAARELIGPDEPGDYPELWEVGYDALASWGAFRRMPPALSEPCADTVRALEALVREQGDGVATAAAQLPDASGWLEEAEEWEEAFDSVSLSAAEASRRARTLFADLDDAELVAWGLEKIRPEAARALDRALEPCREYARDHMWLFHDAEVYLRCAAATMDRDLPARDPMLALTASKYEGALASLGDALVSEPERSDLTEMERQVLRVARGRSRAEARPEGSLLERARGALAALEGRVRQRASRPLPWPAFSPVVAAASTAGPGEEGTRLVWRGASGAWTAFLRLPSSAHAEDSANLTLYLTEPSGGERVLLNGVEAPLAREGILWAARFALGTVRAGGASGAPPGLFLVRADGSLDVGVPEGAVG